LQTGKGKLDHEVEWIFNFVCNFYDSSVGPEKFSSTLKQIKTFAIETKNKVLQPV
jgi:hypothetical protein